MVGYVFKFEPDFIERIRNADIKLTGYPCRNLKYFYAEGWKRQEVLSDSRIVKIQKLASLLPTLKRRVSEKVK